MKPIWSTRYQEGRAVNAINITNIIISYKNRTSNYNKNDSVGS